MNSLSLWKSSVLSDVTSFMSDWMFGENAFHGDLHGEFQERHITEANCGGLQRRHWLPARDRAHRTTALLLPLTKARAPDRRLAPGYQDPGRPAAPAVLG